MNAKADHVRAARDDDPGHHCHWPGCTRKTKPAMYSCTPHWFTWPKHIRDAIWATYRIGQEQDKRPSAGYLLASQAATAWAIDHERHKRTHQPEQGSLL